MEGSTSRNQLQQSDSEMYMKTREEAEHRNYEQEETVHFILLLLIKLFVDLSPTN